MTIKEQTYNGRSETAVSAAPTNGKARIAAPGPTPGAGSAQRKSTVAKVSHTLSVALAERLEEFAFFQRVSESAVIEHALTKFFSQSDDDAALGESLRKDGAGRRRKS
jgi:predicted transcriptional regulator